MGLWEKITGGAVEGVLSGAGDLAKDLRAAITGDLSQEDKARLEQKAMDLEQRAMEARSDLEGAKRDIIVAEAKGESWLQRNWRPLIMSIFGVIIANNYILNPYLSAMFGIDIVLDLPPDMWDLLKIGIGGYITGRTAEKGIGIWKGKREK